METLNLPPGTLIAAWPGLPDPNFREGVVALCHHDGQGSFGLMVNRPTPMTTADVLPQHEVMERVAFPVHLGGPVDHTSLHFLHTAPDEIPGGREICDGLVMGGELDALAEFLLLQGDRAREKVRLLLGYSGWGAGQLEREVTAGSWMPGLATVELVFSNDPHEVWKSVVADASERLRRLGGLPPDSEGAN